MNLNQLLLVVAALTLLATITLAVNSSILRANVLSLDNEAAIDAISIAQAMVDEITQKAFDDIATRKLVNNKSDFTSPSKLGPETDSGEVEIYLERFPFRSDTTLNDVDDYNGYSRIVTSPRMGDFIVRDSVFYVQEGNQDLGSSVPTWFKKVVVRVTHPNLVNPVVVRSLVVYRRFIVQR